MNRQTQSIVAWIIIGLIAGWIASLIVGAEAVFLLISSPA